MGIYDTLHSLILSQECTETHGSGKIDRDIRSLAKEKGVYTSNRVGKQSSEQEVGVFHEATVRCDLEELFPFLEISGPDGQHFSVRLTKQRMTIGRFEHNDIVLQPDPAHFISRNEHCVLEFDGQSWWVIDRRYEREDGRPKNPTYVRHGSERGVKVHGCMRLNNGDCIRIRGKRTESGHHLYWELTFHDTAPAQTTSGTTQASAGQTTVDETGSSRGGQIAETPQIACLEYDPIQTRLFLITPAGRREIAPLRKLEHRLLAYMTGRNREEGNKWVTCSHEELLEAVWGEHTTYTRLELHRLIEGIRKKLGPQGAELLVNVHSIGFYLVTYPAARRG